MINGVNITSLTTYADDRGYFREIARFGEPNPPAPAQLSATVSYPDVIKAFHYHEQQDDVWYCAAGNILAVLYDRRAGSATERETQTIAMGDNNPVSLFIPRGVVHGYKVLGPAAATVVYATNHVYDPKDEFRIPHDDAEIGFDWATKPR